MTDDIEDFEKLSNIISGFESISAAILSRDQKCQVIGLGKWANRDQWPLVWLKSVKMIKVFGIYISNSFREIISVNWKFRLQKFTKTIYSWSSRRLDTVQQRVEVIKIFALSRVLCGFHLTYKKRSSGKV